MGNAAYKKRHREKGLCENCSRPAMPDRLLCLEHLRNNVKARQKYRNKNLAKVLLSEKRLKAKRKKQGRCPSCGAPLTISGFVSCQNCREQIQRERIKNATKIL